MRCFCFILLPASSATNVQAPRRSEEQHAASAVSARTTHPQSDSSSEAGSETRQARLMDRSNPFASMMAPAPALPTAEDEKATAVAPTLSTTDRAADRDNSITAAAYNATGHATDNAAIVDDHHGEATANANGEMNADTNADMNVDVNADTTADTSADGDGDDDAAAQGDETDMALEADEALNALYQVQMLDTTGEMEGPQPSYNVETGIPRGNAATDAADASVGVSVLPPAGKSPRDATIMDTMALPTEAELKAEAERMVQQARVSECTWGRETQ